jgi:hypothetical protein
LKVPHHGSDNNMETIFFKRVPADHYIFSGDGEHGNPERATLQMLLDARGAEADYTIHLTYPLAEIDAGRKAEWEEKQAQEKARKKKNPASKKEVRPDWSPVKHGLVAFFKGNPKMAKKLSIVEEDEPHLIGSADEPLKRALGRWSCTEIYGDGFPEPASEVAPTQVAREASKRRSRETR